MRKNWKIIFDSYNRYDQYLRSILTIQWLWVEFLHNFLKLHIVWVLNVSYSRIYFQISFSFIFCIFWQLIPFSQSIWIWSTNQGQKWAVWRIFWTKYVWEWTKKAKRMAIKIAKSKEPVEAYKAIPGQVIALRACELYPSTLLRGPLRWS